MTEAEKQEIVSAVMQELESSGVDFDYTIQTAEDTDLVFVIRGTAPDYEGKVITWKGLLDIITAKAEQAKTDAETAKRGAESAKSAAETAQSKAEQAKTAAETAKGAAETARNTAQTAATNASNSATFASTYKQDAETAKNAAIAAQSAAETAKTAAETAQSGAETAQGLAESAKQNAESAMGSAQTYMESAKQSAQESRDNVERFLPIDFRVTDPNKVILDVDVTPTMEAFVDGMEQEPNEAIALTLEPDVPTAGSHNFGVRGQICIDGNYLYVCVADNTWKKIALQEL